MNKDIDKVREEAVERAYKHYNLTEFKAWAVDIMAELIQQISRVGTKRHCATGLIQTGLMAEDAIRMLWMLHGTYKDKIDAEKSEIYPNFLAKMDCLESGKCDHSIEEYKEECK